MTPAQEFFNNLHGAASQLVRPAFDGLVFNSCGEPIRFGSAKVIGREDVVIELSTLDRFTPEMPNVVGLVCFMADVHRVNLLVDAEVISPDDPRSHRDADMFERNGFISCTDVGKECWFRPAGSIT